MKDLNRAARTMVKAVMGRVLDQDSYGRLQARVFARDIRRGRYNESEVALLNKAAQPGDVVLDVGANYGLYSYHLSRAVGPEGKVLAFEPIPFTATALGRVIRILDLKNVSVIPIGCSDRTDTVQFNVPIQFNGAPSAGLSHLATRQDDRPAIAARMGNMRMAPVLCKVAPIDDLVPGDADVTFIKVDVEGAEFAVLRGAVKTLARCAPTVVCEVNPGFMEGFGYDVANLLRLVEDLGYSTYWYEHPMLVRAFSEHHSAPNNWIFIHPRRVERFAGLIAAVTPVSGQGGPDGS